MLFFLWQATPANNNNTTTMAHVLKRQLSSQVKRCVLKKNSANPFEAFEVQVGDITPSAALQAGEVRTRFLSSVVTHRDLFRMRNGAPGSVAGDSALLEVLEAGKGSKLVPGDRVQSIGQAGVWQSEPVVGEASLLKVQPQVTKDNFGEYLATAQAFALLKNQGLEPYDEVAVTDAQSALGSAMCLVGKQMGLKVLGVVSLSYDNEQSLKRLKACGAEASVVAEFEKQVQYVGSAAFRRLLGDWKGLKVVVSADGGLLANELARLMAPKGKLIVVGGAPITLPASLFAYKQITVCGPSHPDAEDYANAAQLVAKLTPAQKLKSAEFDFSEVYKAVDAFGLGPVSILKA